MKSYFVYLFACDLGSRKHLKEQDILRNQGWFQDFSEIISVFGFMLDDDLEMKMFRYFVFSLTTNATESRTMQSFTHFREKMHLLSLELIFISSSWRVYMYIKFNT